MDFRQLKYFIAVAEAGNMSSAARTLFVTQPTLTVAIQKLEKSLNADLLDRSTNPLTLTAAGRHLFEEGKRILSCVDDLEDQTRNLGNAARVRIRIGLTVLFSMQFMPQITRFMASHPEVEVSLIQSGSRHLQHYLATGELDCGVVSYPCYEPDVEITPLTGLYSAYRAAVVVRADHPLATRISVTYGDLKKEKFSSLSHRYVMGEMLADRCSNYGFTPNVVFVNDSWTVLVSSVQSLNSVCVLPYELREVFRSPEVAWIPLDDRVSHLPIGIGVLKARPHPPGMDELITALRSPRGEFPESEKPPEDALQAITEAHESAVASAASSPTLPSDIAAYFVDPD